MSPRPSSLKLRQACFDYWKLETGQGFRLPCKGKACNGRLMNPAGEKWHADHHVVREHGGSDEPPNVRPMCVPCHKIKTGEVDIPAIAKGRRQAKSVFGIKQPEGFRKPPPGFKYSWKERRLVREEEL